MADNMPPGQSAASALVTLLLLNSFEGLRLQMEVIRQLAVSLSTKMRGQFVGNILTER